MESFTLLTLYLLGCLIGFTFEYYARWSPWVIMVLSYLLVLLIPPVWFIGVVGGLWISCAFFVSRVATERSMDGAPSLTVWKLCSSSILTFSGFLLTLFSVWRVKDTGFMGPWQRELLGWSFLILIEACIYKYLATHCPSLYRKYLGLGITVLNFLMTFYIVVDWTFTAKLLAFAVLLNGNLFLLALVDRPLRRPVDPMMRFGR